MQPERLPYNRTNLEIWEKDGDAPWKLVYEDTDVYQREPCPILYLGDNKLAVTVNPPARYHQADEPSIEDECLPQMYIFDISAI